MPKRSRRDELPPPPPAYLNHDLLTPNLREALLTCKAHFGSRLGSLQHGALTIIADALNQPDRVEEELEARKSFKIGLLGGKAHVAARDFATPQQIARLQSSRSAATSQSYADGRLETFDVYDPLFSLYINAMAFVLDDEIRAGETFCQKQLKKLPALLLLELRDTQERGTDRLPRKRAKLEASSSSDHAGSTSDGVPCASLPDSSPPLKPFQCIGESLPGSEDDHEEKGDGKEYADQGKGRSVERSAKFSENDPPAQRGPKASSPEANGTAEAVARSHDSSSSPSSMPSGYTDRSQGVDPSSQRANAAVRSSADLSSYNTSALNEYWSRPSDSSSGGSAYVPMSATTASSVSAPSTGRREGPAAKKSHARVRKTLRLFDISSSSTYAETSPKTWPTSSVRESSPPFESPDSAPTVAKDKPPRAPAAQKKSSILPPTAPADILATRSKPPTKGRPKASRKVDAPCHSRARLDNHDVPQSRPYLPVKAPVWAMYRQELCEALPYYRAYQSGLHKRREVPYGYLLDGHGSPRDMWAHDGKVIISHGGGKSVHSNDGDTMALRDDQTDSDAPIRALLNAKDNRIPVILIVGSKYSLLPWKLDYTYGVLGWYWISFAWVEGEHPTSTSSPEDRELLHRFKFRFDWIKEQGTPWWVAASQPSSPFSSYPDAGSESGGTTTSTSNTFLMTPTPLEMSPRLPPAQETRKIDTPAAETSEDTCRVTFSTALAARTTSDPLDQVRTWANQMEGLDNKALRTVRPLPGSRLLAAVVRRVDHGRTMAETPSSVTTHNCSACLQSSPEIFKEAWTCLNSKCENMWKIFVSGVMRIVPANFELRYSHVFLRWIETPGPIRMPYNVRPPLSFKQFQGVWGAYRAEGWVCRRCGRANLRSAWNVLRCEGCAGEINLSDQLSPESLPAEWWRELGRVRRTTRIPLPTSTLTQLFDFRTFNWPLLNGQGEVRMFMLPQKAGSIIIIRPNQVTTASRIFGSYLGAAAGAAKPLFERSILQSNKSGGRMLSQYFSLNSGEPYKYCAKSNSLPFKESPNCVLEARNHMVSLIYLATGRKSYFNEVLSVIYADGQKMNWHDDGEKGVGPDIASLSLGSPAQMSWRRKATVGEPGRRGAVDLTITLEHGDVMLMRGHAVQRLYDHRVEPFGLRIAATARFIEPPFALQMQKTVP